MMERVGNGRMCCVEGARFELLLLIADSGSSVSASNVVDIFNANAGTWSTARLSLLVFKCLNGQPLEYIALNVILRETEPIYGA